MLWESGVEKGKMDSARRWDLEEVHSSQWRRLLEVTAQKCWYKNKWFPMSGKLFFNWVFIFFFFLIFFWGGGIWNSWWFIFHLGWCFEGLLRCGKSCRLRWINYLRDDLKRGNITAEEDDTIVKLHSSWGNRSVLEFYSFFFFFFLFLLFLFFLGFSQIKVNYEYPLLFPDFIFQGNK